MALSTDRGCPPWRGFLFFLCLPLFCGLIGLMLPTRALAEKKRTVRIGAFNYFPALFRDSDGAIKGFYVDALADLARRENLHIEYVYGSWAEGLERIRSGQIDVLTSAAYTSERAEFLDYSKTPLLTVWGELYVPIASKLDHITKLQGKRVAVMKNDFNGHSFIKLAAAFGISCVFVEMDGFEEIFAAIAQKKVDAGVVNNIFGVPQQREYQLRATGIAFTPFPIYLAVAKGKHPELLALLDSYLLRWQQDEDSVYQQARQQWLHGRPAQERGIPPWLLASLTGFALLTFLSAAFILLLRNQVKRATLVIAQREARLRETAEMKRLLLNSTAEGIYGLDLEGNCTFCNTSCLDMLGLQRKEQLIGKKIHTLVAGARPESWNTTLLERTRANQVWHVPNQTLRRSDGMEFPVEIWSQPIVREDKLIGAVVTFVDISERQQLEESYRFISQSGYQNSGDRFFPALTQHLAESLGLDFVIIGRLTDTGHRFQTITVHQQGEIRENSDYDLQDLPCHEAMICSFCQDVRSLFPESTLFQELAAESYVAVTLWGLDGQPIGLLAGIGQTPLRNLKMAESILKLVSFRASGELERSRAEEILRQKNNEIERFTYAVSHDLKSPLVTIKTFLGYLQQDLANDDLKGIEKDMGFMRTATEKMTDLLDELLRMSRIGRHANAPTRISFEVLVTEALTAVAGAIENRGVEVQVQEKPLTLVGDQIRLTEIWQNLIDNAVKYMGDQPAPRIEIGIRDDGHEQVFYVRDNGLGIDPRYSHKVFGLFEKLDPKTPGTGLGLALVKKVVELYKGRIWLESEGPGQGSCFLFTLPEALNPIGENII